MVDHFKGDRPVKRGPQTGIIRVTTSETKVFYLVSPAIFGQNIHWMFRRSHECKKDKGACDGCTKLWPDKWLGYLYVVDPTDGSTGFLELTYTASRILTSLAPIDQSLRGLVVSIRKTKGGAKGRYVISLSGRRIASDELPDDRDPLPTLRFLWNAKNK